MKKVLVVAALGLTMWQNDAHAQKKCGMEELNAALQARFPDAAARQAQMDEQIRQTDAAYEKHAAMNANMKTTATVYIPVVFHVVLNSLQMGQIGGPDAIRARAQTQLDVLNEDYNKANPDGSNIPDYFKSLYGNAEIRFAFAHTTPSGKATDGVEFKTTSKADFGTTGGTQGSQFACSDAKYNTDGLEAWNTERYLNVWVINFSDNNILGIAVSPNYSSTFSIPSQERGVCVNYAAFGRRTAITQFFKNGIDKGRTLTHEIGHFFELRHIWGDNTGCSQDDGMADTPPQDDKTYGCPTGKKTDVCSGASTNGIMYMNYMDYTNDACMHMFTNNQVSRMKAQIASGGPSIGLTQHPELFAYPSGVNDLQVNSEFTVAPNPSNGKITLSFNSTPKDLNSISVTNMVGQKVYTANGDNQNMNYQIDLTGVNSGIYFIHCNFAEGTVTRKVVIQ